MQSTIAMTDGYQGIAQEERNLSSHIFDKIVKETFGTTELPQGLLTKQGANDDIVNQENN